MTTRPREEREKVCDPLEQLQCDGPFGLGLDALAPELEFGVDGAVEDKVPRQALSVEGTDWGVMGDLLGHQPETLILTAQGNADGNGHRCA